MSRVNYPSPYVITQDRVGSDLVFENLTSQINGSRTTFTLNQAADVERIFVYYNGLLSNIDISSKTQTTFTLGFTPLADDTLQVIYSVLGNPLNEDN